MIETLKSSDARQSVTYPVRAGLVANNLEEMRKLLRDSDANKPTLTIWSSQYDEVDADKLSILITSIGVDKVYVDVPEDLRKRLHLYD